MKKQQTLKLADLKVDSFITSGEKIRGGTLTTASLPTGHICDKFNNSRIQSYCC